MPIFTSSERASRRCKSRFPRLLHLAKVRKQALREFRRSLRAGDAFEPNRAN